MPHPGRTSVGGAHPPPWCAPGLFALAADRGPLPARMGLEVQRPEFIDTEDHFRVAGLWAHLAVGDRVQMLDPGLLRRVPGVLGGFPGFQALKGDALLAEQRPQALMADVVDHPLGHHELTQLGQAPGGKRQVIVNRPRLGDLLDLSPLGQRELRRAAALIPRIQRVEPVGVEVMDHIPDPVLAGERDLRDRGHVHALGRQQHHLRPPPGHHRPAAPADDPQQPPSLVIVDLPHPQAFGHRPSLGDQHPQEKRRPGKPDRANVTCYGTSST